MTQVYELAEFIPELSIQKVQAIAKATSMQIVFGMPELNEKTQATVSYRRHRWSTRFH